MEKAKQLAQDLMENWQECERNSKEEFQQNAKPDINNLLHMYLPDDITIKQAEILATVINEIVYDPYEFLGLNETFNK